MRINKILILVILTVLYTLTPIPQTQAQESSGSAKTLGATASPPPATQSGSLLDKINSIKAEIASKAANLKKEIDKKLQNKAIAGTIVQVTGNQFTLSTKNNVKTVVVNEYSEYSNEMKGVKKATLALKDLAKDNYLVVLGDLDDRGQVIAKKVIKIDQPTVTSRKLVWGKIQTATESGLVIRQADNQTTEINFDKASQMRLGKETASSVDLQSNKTAVLVTINQADKKYARFIYLLPQLGFTKPASATPSATPRR